MRRPEPHLLLSIAIGILTFVFYVGLEAYMRPHAIDGLYFQPWSSERMMQTLSVEDLRRAPLQSLWYLHIQPPLLDGIRAILATLAVSNEGVGLVREVDEKLYLLWAVAAAILASAMVRWLQQLTNTPLAVLATLVFMIHPGMIFYATFLDGSFLSSALIFLTYYELWKLSRQPHRSILPFTLLCVSLMLLRTLFQWPAIIVFAASLILVRVPVRSVCTMVLISSLMLGAYLTKNYILFGTTSTFGWRGLNICRSIGSTERYEIRSYTAGLPPSTMSPEEEAKLPAALSRRFKISQRPNFNHVSFLALNREMVEYCSQRLSETTLPVLLNAYRLNWHTYFSPSSRYLTRHMIVDRLPWRVRYDQAFSSPILPTALMLALFISAFWMRGDSVRPMLGLLVPAVFIFMVSIIGERGENMRLKIFLEPIFYIFIVGTIHRTIVTLRRAAHHRTHPEM